MLEGTNQDDVFWGDGGNDTVRGLGGNDRICSGPGDDDVFGGADFDYLEGGDGSDDLDGGERSSTLVGGAGDDRLEGSIEDDDFAPGEGNDVVNAYGPEGNIDDGDYIEFDQTVEVDLAAGTATGEGSDTISGIEIVAAGMSTVFGDDNPNWIYASTVDGRGGDDRIQGSGQDDTLSGGDGDDSINGLFGSDTIDGGEGNDSLAGDENDYEPDIDDTDGSDVLRGGPGSDFLAGYGRSDELFGDEGRDDLLGGQGNDVLDGGDGFDWVLFQAMARDVEVLLGQGTSKGRNEGEDSLVAIENIGGSRGKDRLIGDESSNVIWGWWGDDRLNGGPGLDRLRGDDGRDVCWNGETNHACEKTGPGSPRAPRWLRALLPPAAVPVIPPAISSHRS